MTKQFFVSSDIHSFYTQWMKALKTTGFDKSNKDHIIVVCGDLLDRGDESMECLKFVNSLPKNRKVLIRGNHEDLLEVCIDRKEFGQHDLHNRTLKTIFNLCGRDENGFWFDDNYKTVFDEIKHCKPLYKYLNSLQDYAEVGDYIFVHGWIPLEADSPNGDWKSGDWVQARWSNGMEMWEQGHRIKDKTIVCGHWHTSWGNSNLHHKGTERGKDACFEPFIDEGIIALDSCVACSGQINCIKLEVEV